MIPNLPEKASLILMRFTMSSSSQKGSYILIPGSISRWPRVLYQFPFSASQTTAYILTILISLLLGFLWGFRMASSSAWAADFGTVTQTLVYNRSFAYPPSEHTDRAWSDMFPDLGGFFVHPTTAPARSTFSVYHQLHCLDGLRGGYWANQQAASRGERLIDESLPAHLQMTHMRHCIDYIRQGIMCSGDTTLEKVDKKVNGVHGFGVEHTCVDWEQLRQWTNQHQ
ncbi:hypothetical protein F5Y09DRAFT_312898 [Xylaria sp. FL1042]|nr:hypothetical protein F5Y09DRAFT_312898 [Xylaria sp. FL1042]